MTIRQLCIRLARVKSGEGGNGIFLLIIFAVALRR